MKNQSKKEKTGTAPKKPLSQAKGMKRSKSTEHLMPKKPFKKSPLEKQSSEETIGTSFAKSKSVKSSKSKQKSVYRSESSGKKTKVKRLLSPKTVKKAMLRGQNEASSFLTENQQARRDRPEYFLYGSNYIPIENSAQRRLVYKIQMIDLENKMDSNKSTAETFIKNASQEIAVGTDQISVQSVAIGGKVSVEAESCTQTQKAGFSEQKDKCFADVLTELEFLYMPNQDNFEPFSSEERLHYGEMLESLAKRMLSGSKNVVVGDVLTEDQVTVLIYQREGIQVGALDYVPSEGFPTHLLAILAYLKNLICFIDYSYKEEVITNLRAFYGLNYNQRISRISRRMPHEKDDRYVLNDQMFEVFEQEMFKDYEFGSQVVKEGVHAHNRAVFDAFNNELQNFRPFFSSQGEPFPWTINLGMTHYDITEEALYIIFMQVKDKIQKMAVNLCGMHLDFDDKDLPDCHTSEFYNKKSHERVEKTAVEEIKTFDDRVSFDYERTLMMFDIEEEIFFQLVGEVEREMWEVEGRGKQEPGFYFL